MKEYNFTENDFNDFVAKWLNSDHEKYQAYVQGAKLFIEYLEDKHTNPTN